MKFTFVNLSLFPRIDARKVVPNQLIASSILLQNEASDLIVRQLSILNYLRSQPCSDQ